MGSICWQTCGPVSQISLKVLVESSMLDPHAPWWAPRSPSHHVSCMLRAWLQCSLVQAAADALPVWQPSARCCQTDAVLTTAAGLSAAAAACRLLCWLAVAAQCCLGASMSNFRQLFRGLRSRLSRGSWQRQQASRVTCSRSCKELSSSQSMRQQPTTSQSDAGVQGMQQQLASAAAARVSLSP